MDILEKIHASKIFINSDFSKLTEEKDVIIFKNITNDRIIKISGIEYLLLCKYTENQSIHHTLKYALNQDVEVSPEELIHLIETAKELKLLISGEERDKYNEKYLQKEKETSIFAWITLWLSQKLKLLFRITRLNRLGIRPEFTGNYRFYKLFSVDLTNSFISRIIGKPISLLAMFPVILLILYSLTKLSHINNYDIFTSHTFGGVSVAQFSLNKYIIFFILLFGIIITSLFHEIAHYYVYKQLQGKTNEFGFAIMNYFLPIVYVSTNSVYLWDKKWKKILVSSAGIIFDIILIFFLYVLIASQSLINFPNLAFIIFLLMFYMIFRTLININFLIPGTDGYFIFVDIFNLKNFFQTTFKSSKHILRSLFRLKFSQIKGIHFFHFTYYILSLVFVIVITLLMILSIIYPLISDFLIRLTI